MDDMVPSDLMDVNDQSLVTGALKRQTTYPNSYQLFSGKAGEK